MPTEDCLLLCTDGTTITCAQLVSMHMMNWNLKGDALGSFTHPDTGKVVKLESEGKLMRSMQGVKPVFTFKREVSYETEDDEETEDEHPPAKDEWMALRPLESIRVACMAMHSASCREEKTLELGSHGTILFKPKKFTTGGRIGNLKFEVKIQTTRGDKIFARVHDEEFQRHLPRSIVFEFNE